MKTPEQIADEVQQAASLRATERENMIAAIEADREQRENDGTVHAAVIEALREREYEGSQAAADYIESDPDGFWEQYAGPMLDQMEFDARKGWITP